MDSYVVLNFVVHINFILIFTLVPGYLNFATYSKSSLAAEALLYVRAFGHIWKGVGQDKPSEEHSSSAQIFLKPIFGGWVTFLPGE
jgi:hypothetical protein